METTPNIQRFTFKTLGERPPELPPEIIAFMPIHKPKPEISLEPSPPPPPSFSEEDLKSAEREGYKKGFLEGAKDGHNQAQSEQAATDRKLDGMLEQFSATVAPLFEDYKTIVTTMREELPALALAIARKVAGVALEEQGQTMIADIAARCCEAMAGEPKLTIVVNDTIADRLEEKLHQLAARLPGTTDIVIVRDPNMPEGDCRIDWEQGMMEYSSEKIWQQVENVIQDMRATAQRDAAEDLATLETSLHAPDETPPNDDKE